MIRVTIELVPHGIGNPKHVGTMKIWNDLTGDRSKGNYKFTLTKNNPNIVWRGGEVKGFRRLSKSVGELMFLCLSEIFKE